MRARTSVLRGIVAFEWRCHARHLAFYAAAAGFVGMAVLLVATGYGPDGVNVNSPYVVAQAMGLLSLPAVFVLTVFCAASALRDAESGMTEIVYATSVSRAQYLFGRFAGALLAALAVLAAAAIALMVAPMLVRVSPERLGAVHPAYYLWGLAVVVLPNLLFAGSLVFGVSALTRSARASYVAGVFVYALYLVAATLIDSPLMAGSAPPSPGSLARAAVLDPFGPSAFFEQTRYWTPAERNVRLPSLSGHFLLNRMLWTGVSLAVLALVHHLFAFRIAARSRSGRADTAAPSKHVGGYQTVAVPFRSSPVPWHALLSATRLELRYVLRSWSFAGLMALWIFFVGMEVVTGVNTLEYGTRVYPTTGLMAAAIGGPLGMIGIVALAYYAAELAWRERAARFDDVIDATPASSAVFHLSKLTALCAIPVALALTGACVGAAYQLSRGYEGIEMGPYLTLLYVECLPLALFAAAALLVQTLSPNRYAGIVFSLAAAVVVRRGEAFGLNHALVRYAGAPALPRTDMGGWGQGGESFAWFMAYWTSFAVLLGFLTFALWRRGRAAPLIARISAVPRTLGRRGALGAAACVALFLATGAFVFHGTNVVNRYETDAARMDWKAAYEKAYRPFAAEPQPSIVGIRANVDLYPAERRYRIDGTYRLENRTGREVRDVWGSLPRDIQDARIEMAGGPPAEHDARFGVYRFRLSRPMAPGGTAELRFRTDVAQRGVRTGDFDLSVVENGSFLASRSSFPALGYRSSYELDDPAQRRKRGLAGPSTETALAATEPAGGADPSAAWTSFETTVSTSADQVAVAPGALAGEWRRGRRRYFRYVMDRPMTGQFAYVSARYAVKQVRHRGVLVQVYYHPTHAYNVNRMLAAATRSLDLFGARFGPYPHRELRIVEVPSYWGFGALALPGTVYFVEDRGFLTDARDSADLDLVTRRVAHEVGHQWWGHQVDPTDQPGASMLVETLAKYSEQMVLKETHGERALPALLAFDLDRYLRGRAGEESVEAPLYRVTGEAYLYYGKGAVVMSGLRDLLGEPALDRVLARLVREHAGSDHPPTSLDLIALLHAQAPPEQRALIDQWLREVVVYDLAAGPATCRRLPGGGFRVTATVDAGKTMRRGGRDVPLPFDEALDVAAFAANPRGLASAGRILYSAKQQIRGPRTQVSFTVAQAPAYVAVDPYVHRVDRDPSDNLRKVEDCR
ncbi:MAG: hypothetical protein JWM27_1994 [Gemmatimonadetes bacterium]|nr:hypothetical protein [Gemmatimonadota bacterium]